MGLQQYRHGPDGHSRIQLTIYRFLYDEVSLMVIMYSNNPVARNQ